MDFRDKDVVCLYVIDIRGSRNTWQEPSRNTVRLLSSDAQVCSLPAAHAHATPGPPRGRCLACFPRATGAGLDMLEKAGSTGRSLAGQSTSRYYRKVFPMLPPCGVWRLVDGAYRSGISHTSIGGERTSSHPFRLLANGRHCTPPEYAFQWTVLDILDVPPECRRPPLLQALSLQITLVRMPSLRRLFSIPTHRECGRYTDPEVYGSRGRPTSPVLERLIEDGVRCPWVNGRLVYVWRARGEGRRRGGGGGGGGGMRAARHCLHTHTTLTASHLTNASSQHCREAIHAFAFSSDAENARF